MALDALIIGMSLSSLTGAAVWKYAYQLGVKRGRTDRVPFPVIDELIDHRIFCLKQDPSIARMEVESTLGVEQ